MSCLTSANGYETFIDDGCELRAGRWHGHEVSQLFENLIEPLKAILALKIETNCSEV